MDQTTTEPAPAGPGPAAAPPEAPELLAAARPPVLHGLVVLGDADAEACADGSCG
ncbi:hypothetical protein [Pseudosporangium ferrugineum]|uniref:Uncharacterized protein n=1 Tax=Pseudosporangium ferrugineum TaxID=439699 RepID=A0A2T0SIE1_9ACTN|nr:hypothetical protein [Pseudosporangium ferrugineum]PRY33169.1 hypothetical protein CLV70_101331 [Pseudosporangium ferrugineum]